MIKELKNLQNKYKPLNYWGWLENISPEEVRWQVKQMNNAGLGGYVMHARGGLEVPYMGKQWIDSVKAMVEEGKEHQMLTIIDDEDGWPSGFGAGIVNGMGEDYWEKWLVCEEISAIDLQNVKNTIGYYSIEQDNIVRLKDEDAKKSREKVIHIYYSSSQYYVDNLDPLVVKKFIEASYEKYFEIYGDEFGKGLYAIFSDEPQISRGRVTWSKILPYEFELNCGYSILDMLPALFLNVKGYEKFRYDYWQTVNSLFVNSYAKQIGQWCKNHNIIFTGHTLLEEHLIPQLMGSSGTMPFYEYMQIPGMDWLDKVAVSSFAVKQLTSVAQQLGKERALSEMYGCAGWNVNFEELKWIGEWHYVLGVNMMVQHLGLYSLKGSRKREYPASLFYQQPWWKDYNQFNDYFCRLSKLMSESTPVIDILVIHPLKSAWSCFYYNNLTDVDFVDREIKSLTDSLLSLNYDFHYGDEEIMKRHGKIENGQLVIGNCTYKIVIIPPCTTLDRTTFGLIKEFYNNGGIVISVGSFPQKIEAIFSEDLYEFGQRIISIPNEKRIIKDELGKYYISNIKILLCNGELNDDIYCCVIKYCGDLGYFIVNTSREKTHNFTIEILNKRNLYLFDLNTCEQSEVDFESEFCLKPVQSMLLINKKEIIKTTVTKIINSEKIVSFNGQGLNINIDHNWEIKSHELNCLVLDYCQYRIEDGQWEEITPIISLQEKMILLGKPANIKMKFNFKLCGLIEPIYLAIEEPEKFIIEINGHILIEEECGWWIDKSIKKLNIIKYIMQGENIIILKRYFYCSEKVYKIKNDIHIHEAESNRLTVDTELENIYLLGDFHVKCLGTFQQIENKAMFFNGLFEITKVENKVNICNLPSVGYPFFAGTLTIFKNINIDNVNNKNYILKIEKPNVHVIKVYVNDIYVKSLVWSPYEVDISEYIVKGDNILKFDLVNSCRNVFGPHHNNRGEVSAVCPLSFTSKNWLNYEERTFESIWTDQYCLVNFGIEDSIIIVVVDKNLN